MGFDEWSTSKKVVVVLVIILAIVCIVAAVSIIFIATEVEKTTELAQNFSENLENDNVTINGNNSPSRIINLAEGSYQVKIETDGEWATYITTDSKYSQDKGTGSKTIDLGTVTSLSSITVNQMGSGTTKVSILDSNNNIIAEKTNSIDYGSIYLLLKVK